MLLGTLGAILLGNLLTGKGVTKSTSHRQVINKKVKEIHRASEGIVRAGYGNKENF